MSISIARQVSMSDTTLKVFFIICCLVQQMTCREYSRCYDDAKFCLWTDGSLLTQPEAQAACQRRKESFLMRITDSSIQSTISTFLFFSLYTKSPLFWIDVRAVVVNNIRWIDGSSFADGGEVDNQDDEWARFAVVISNVNASQFVFSLRRNNATCSFICQLKQVASCGAGDLSMNSKCYRKFDSQLSGSVQVTSVFFVEGHWLFSLTLDVRQTPENSRTG